MTNVQAGSVSVQVVHQGAGGAAVRLPFITVQAITSVHVDRVLVNGMAVQLVRTGDEGGDMRIHDSTIQVVRAGDGTGGAITVPSDSVQVVYTTGVDEVARQSAWTFDFDGHTNYVLDLGENGSVVYDILTGQWARYETSGYGGHWNMKNGFQWLAGKKILAGDISNGIIWKMDPGTWFDDGWRPVIYEVKGVLFATDIAFHRQYALRLIGSAGRTTDDEAPVLNMRFSDDQGQTWSEEYAITLTIDTKQRIEWRSLGSFTHPGRIFRLYDTGGLKFIAAVIADVEGMG